MRVWSRVALLFVFVLCAPILTADHFRAECPLSLVDSTPASQVPAQDFDASPHGVFRNGTLVHVMRGNLMTTYNTNDVGDLQIVRNDPMTSLAARESNGGVAFGNGYLYVSSEAGLEVFDMRNVRAGGNAPLLVARRGGFHYRRLAVNGTKLAGLYPISDVPCFPRGIPGEICHSVVDIFDITNPASPTLAGQIDSRSRGTYRGFYDVAFNFGFLFVLAGTALAGETEIVAYNVSNPAAPVLSTADILTTGQSFVSNTTDFLATIDDDNIHIYRFAPLFALLELTKIVTIPSYLTIEHGNGIRFHRQAFYDDTSARLITLIEEVDPQTLNPARTIAFDVFDFTVDQFEGSAERIYEDVTMTLEDEVKYNPLAVGAFVYVVGEESGTQEWGACNRATGRIELDSPTFLICGGTEIHGWVTGTQKIVNVELFLDNTSLGNATVGGPVRNDVSSTTPVVNWRVANVNLDATSRGDHLLRAIATDSLGQRRQFAFKRLFFPGAPNNCSIPRRRAVR